MLLDTFPEIGLIVVTVGVLKDDSGLVDLVTRAWVVHWTLAEGDDFSTMVSCPVIVHARVAEVALLVLNQEASMLRRLCT